jgi:hypothetical protein
MQSKLVIIISQAEENAIWTGLVFATKGTRNDFMDDIRLVLWGPSEKVIAENQELQQMIREYMALGKTVWACKTCSERYGVTEAMEGLGCTVDYVGSIVTGWIKEGFVPFTW